VTNVVSPLLVTFDRFLIGALVSVTAVAYYATPFEVVTKSRSPRRANGCHVSRFLDGLCAEPRANRAPLQ